MTVPTPAELAAELAGRPPIDVQVDPSELLSIIGMLQLALRHPGAGSGVSAVVTRRFIDRLVDEHAAAGPSDQLRAVVALGYRADGDVMDAGPPLLPAEIRDRMADVAERPSPIARIAGYVAPVVDAVTGELRPQGRSDKLGLPVVIDASLPPDVLEVRGESTVRIRGTDAFLVVRPAGLVWSGIRVDELPRMYEVLDATHEACPVPLYSGEIYGQPTTGRIFVWSIADFNRLADLSARLHRLRKSKTIDPAVIRELRPVLQLIEADAESVRIVRALERAS